MMRKLQSLALFSFLLGTRLEAAWPWVVNLGGGVSMGQISQPVLNGLDRDVPIGGLPLAFSTGTHFQSGLYGGLNYTLLVDFPNSQISRTNIGLQTGYYLFGAAPATIYRAEEISLTSLSSSAAMVLGEFAIVHYSASTKDLTQKIAGSSFELRLGLTYRLGLYSAQITTTAFSIVATNDRLTARTSEFLIARQIY